MYKDKRAEVEEKSMQYVKQFEVKQNRVPVDISSQNRGYDICSKDKDGKTVRHIEVKGHKGREDTTVSENEWNTAKKYEDKYFIYVIFDTEKNPFHKIIKNPVKMIKPEIKTEYKLKTKDVMCF